MASGPRDPAACERSFMAWATRCHLTDSTKMKFFRVGWIAAWCEREEAVQAGLEALEWCGGSADFGPDGQARKGWERLVVPALRLLRGTVKV